MALKYPDELKHNNPDYAVVDAEFVRGGGRVVANLTALYALTAKLDQLKERVTKVYVTAEAKYYNLKDIANVGNTNGWEVDVSSGGGTPGADGVGIESTSYNASTGVLTITFTDASTYSTGDLRGAVGATGATGAAGATGATGAAGKGIQSTAYNAGTGILTITFTDASTFTTGDLRGGVGATGATGAAGATGATGAAGKGIQSTAYNAGTGILTITFTDASTYSTGDLRGGVGATGATGAAGATGATGAAGKGIQSTAYNAGTGILTITFTDASTFTTGDLRGAAGATGATGKSAYQSYFDTTPDNPKLTEVEWSKSRYVKEMLISKSTFNGIALEPGLYKNGATAKQITGYRLTSNATDFQITIGGTSYTKDSVFPIALAANAELLINDVTIANTYNIGNVILIIE